MSQTKTEKELHVNVESEVGFDIGSELKVVFLQFCLKEGIGPTTTLRKSSRKLKNPLLVTIMASEETALLLDPENEDEV